MIRKIEDIKINSNKILRTPKKVISKVEISKSKLNIEPVNTTDNISDKFDFLKDKIKPKVPVKRNYTQRIPQTPKIPRDGKSLRKGLLAGFILSIAVGIFYLLSTVFLRANIIVIPKNKSFELDHQIFTASESGSIPFELMIISDSGSKDIILSDKKEASEKAKGEIILYNEYSDKPEKIIAGTFVSDSKGKTYKTDKTVTIPGLTKDNTKIIPGEVSVAITAFLAGDAYNEDSESFVINSFKDTSKYKKIYGEIKVPLTGGVSGQVYVLNEGEKASMLSDVSMFKDKFLRKLNAEIPDGYILYPDAINFTYQFDNNIISKVPNTTITINGTASAFIFKKSILTDYIINKLLPDISLKEKSEIIPPDLSFLTFNFTNSNQNINKDIDSFSFNLTGNLDIGWKPDTDSLGVSLLGKNKNEVTTIFQEDPGILSAGVKIIPFWSSKLPINANKIHIIVQ